jgi:hypothetical protein
MQLNCPHCQEKLGLFTTLNGQRRIKKGNCPTCGKAVAIGASPNGFAIALAIIGPVTWLTWSTVPPVILGLLAGGLIWSMAIKLIKAPHV